MEDVNKKTLLLVEDEFLIAMAQQLELEKYGYNVVHTNTGENAVELSMENREITLILMDIDLGEGIDGIEAAELILKERDIPIVFLSSHMEPEIVEKTERITSYGYVVKSSSITVLDASIKMAFKLFDAHKELNKHSMLIEAGNENLKETLDGLLVGVVVHDADTNIISSNPEASNILGLTAEQLIGKDATDPAWKFVYTDTSPMKLEDYPVNRVTATYKSLMNYVLGISHPDRKDITWTNVNAKPLFNADNKLEKVVVNFVDITKQKQIQKDLFKNQFYLSKAQEIGKIGTWELDIEQNILSWTKENYKIFDIPEGTEMSYDLFLDRIHPEDRAYVNEEWTAGLQKEPYDIEHRIIVNGKEKWVREKAEIEFDDNDNPIKAIGFTQDITESKTIIERLHKEQDHLNNLIINSPDMIMLTDSNGKISYISPQAENIIGHNPDTFIGVDFPAEHIHPDDVNIAFMHFNKVMRGEELINFEYRFYSEDRKLLWLSHTARAVKQNGKITSIQSNVRNITEQKLLDEKLMQSEALLKSSIESPKDMIMASIDKEYCYLYFNQVHANGMRSLYNSNIKVGKNHLEYITNEKDRNHSKMYFDKALAGESHTTIQEYGELERMYLETRYNPILNKSDEIIGATAFATDITGRILLEQKIKQQMSEKEIILKETHHRIKNNFASIVSLLSLQANSLTNPEAVSALNDAAGRVNSMKVMYEKMLLTDNYKTASIKKYLDNLIDNLLLNFPQDKDIKVEKQIDDLQLDSKQLAPIGIIINELLTNIAKYAFTEGSSGHIEVEVKENKGSVTLTVQDDGKGLPEGFNIDKSKGFGLMLIKMLVQQLDGSLTMESNDGLKTVIEFSI